MQGQTQSSRTVSVLDRARSIEKGGTAFHDDARRAIEALGPAASAPVATGVWLHLGHWLNWPAWLSEGTTEAHAKPLPPTISAADDLLITANVLSRLGAADPLLRVVEHPRPALGPRAALLYVSAPSLSEALTGLCSASNHHHPYMEMVVKCDARHLEIVMHQKVDLGRLAEFLMPMAVLTLYKVVQAVAAERLASVTMETTLSLTDCPAKFWSGIDCKVSPGADVDGLFMPIDLAEHPNPESDPTMWLLATENFRHLAQARQTVPLNIRVRERIVQTLSEKGQAPRLKQIAAEERLSTRTIIRTLSMEGTTFFDLVEQERRKLASELINDPSLSLDSMASKLGFTDRSSFGRSFRKWFGMAPGKFRDAFVAKSRQLRKSATGCAAVLPFYEQVLSYWA